MFKPTLRHSLLLSLLAFAQISLAADATAKPDLAKAKQTVETVCAACHGADGNSVIPQNPNLAGQHPEYLLKQLRNFKPVGNKPAERVNAIMGGMASPLSDADMQGLALYFSSQKSKLGIAKDRKSVEAGQAIWRAGIAAKGVPACAACHGAAGAGLPAQFPALKGQHFDYTEAQLKAFRAGERANDPNQMMRTIALKMTDPEIKAVADYIQGLR